MMKLKYALILSLCWFNAFSQRNRIVFEEKQADSIVEKIDSILLIGIGSSTTRIFLDRLSQYIMDGFKHDGVVTRYHYLGKNIMEVQSEYDTIKKEGFKAILFFLPKGASFFDVQGNLNRISAPTRIGTIKMMNATSSIDYQQDFDFKLYLPDRDMKRIWAASVEVSGDLGKSNNARKVGDKLLIYFRANKYLK